MGSLTEGRRREGKNKRGRLEKECAEGVRAAGMSHLSALGGPRSEWYYFTDHSERRRERRGGAPVPHQVTCMQSAWRPLTSRFSGLMSLWTMLRLWRYLMALARLWSMPLASLSVYLLAEVMASNRSPPCGQDMMDGSVLGDVTRVWLVFFAPAEQIHLQIFTAACLFFSEKRLKTSFNHKTFLSAQQQQGGGGKS